MTPPRSRGPGAAPAEPTPRSRAEGTFSRAPGSTDSEPEPRRREGGAPDEEPVGDEGSGDDGTVGVFKTVPPSGSDAPTHWQEGLLVADRFRIVRFVGQGGMGMVYLATDETLSRPIALKRVPQEIIFDGDARDDLRQEANRLLDLAHENIVRIHTYYDGPTWPFFAMEYLEGPTLKKLLRNRKQYGKRFAPEEVLAIARQVAHGLAYAHAKGIIHRDLKPGNLMLAKPPGETISQSDIVKITDFGVSRVIADSTMRHTGKRSGTLPYMSPEQFRGESCTVECDIYSFACSLYELLAGNPPFYSGDLGYQITTRPPKPLPDVPRHMGDAILRGLAKDPRDRFESAEDLYRALEGKTRVRRRRVSGGGFRFLSRLAAAVLIVGAIWFAVTRIFPGPRVKENWTEGRPGAAGVALSPAETKARQDERLDFSKRLRDELYQQIPSLIGLNYASPASPGTVTLSFTFPEPTGSGHQKLLFEGLLLEYTTQNPKDGATRVFGTLREGKKVFQLVSLPEGTYTVRAYTRREPGDTSGFEPILDDPRKFTVDLTAPSFEIEAVNPRVLVKSSLPLLTTFDDSVEMRLRSLSGPDDIAEAYYQVFYGDVARPFEEKIEDPRSWRLVLPQGSTVTCRVYARDAARNRSASREISFRRLNLEIVSLGLATRDDLAGNLIRVKGTMRVEGDQRPQIRYFINDADVKPEPVFQDSQGAIYPPDESPGPDGIPFTEVLRLPEPANTVEVRYAWGDNAPRPFARPARLSDVKVRVPTVTIPNLPGHTSSTRIVLVGRVEPVYEDLDAFLEHAGMSSSKLILEKEGTSQAATFTQEVELRPNEANSFSVVFAYRKRRLEAEAQTFSVFCDTVAPALADAVRFEAGGSQLRLSIFPLEDLKSVRVREVSASPGASWGTATWDPTSFAYRYTTRLPLSPTEFEVELTDLAGNTTTRRELYTPRTEGDPVGIARATLPRPETAGGAPGDAASSPDGGTVRPPAVTLIFSSPFVKDLDMEFVPFGQERREMCRTEVSERAWFVFLREEKGISVEEPGRRDYPMALGERSPDLLREFVKWFERKTNDGYEYEIPTAEEWLAAFSGVSDPRQAYWQVTEWFRGERRDSSARFNPAPSVRYGKNKICPIGSRPENRTPTGLLDMEANVQELVLEGELFRVIGGSNQDAGTEQILDRCRESRPYDLDRRMLQGPLTGFRLCRRPAEAK